MRGAWGGRMGGGSGGGDVLQHGSLALPGRNYRVVMRDLYRKLPFSD